MPNARQEASLTQIRRLFARWDQGNLFLNDWMILVNLSFRFNENTSSNFT
jgi:hypothetical protein